MIGAEPPRLAAPARPARGRRRSRCGPLACRGTTVRRRARGHLARRARGRDRRHRRRLGQRPAGAAGRALGRGPARARPGRSACSARDIGAAAAPRGAAHARAALRARGAAGPRRGAGAVAGAEHAAHAARARSRGLGWIDGRRLLAAGARASSSRFNVKAGGPRAAAGSLSGGNLQKFIVGREIDAAPKVLIVAQPTWGVDVGAAAQIRGELLALRDAGCAVLVVSEELDELFEICDRLHRDRAGPAVAERAGARGDGRADRRVDERAVDCAGRGAARAGATRMLRLEARAAAVAPDVDRSRRCSRWRSRCWSASCCSRSLGKDPAARPRRCSSSSRSTSAQRAGRARGQGDAAAPDRARPGGLLSRQRLEHRRRGAVHPRRDRRRRRGDAGPARERPAAGRSSLVILLAGVARRHGLGGDRRAACATASTPTRSWSA